MKLVPEGCTVTVFSNNPAIVPEQRLNGKYHEFVPKPVGLWPLTRTLGTKDISDRKNHAVAVQTGFSSRWAPSGLQGGALFSNRLQKQRSYLTITAPDMESATEVTVMFWMKPERTTEPQYILVKKTPCSFPKYFTKIIIFLKDFRSLEKPAISARVKFLSGQLAFHDNNLRNGYWSWSSSMNVPRTVVC